MFLWTALALWWQHALIAVVFLTVSSFWALSGYARSESLLGHAPLYKYIQAVTV